MFFSYLTFLYSDVPGVQKESNQLGFGWWICDIQVPDKSFVTDLEMSVLSLVVPQLFFLYLMFLYSAVPGVHEERNQLHFEWWSCDIQAPNESFATVLKHKENLSINLLGVK